jgi:hypothetical protein
MNSTIDIDALIADADSEFPALFQFFGGYFHQDWHADYEVPADAIRAYLLEAPPPAVSEAAAEIDRVLALQLDDVALARLLREGFDCNYVPELEGRTLRDWLVQIRDEHFRGSPSSVR